MKITDHEIQNLAHLSRLELNESESADMKKDLSKILDFIAAIEEIDIKNVEPLVHMTDSENILREDIISSKLSLKKAMKNNPDQSSNYFTVPKVIDK
tara:strand:+ start:8038 stop:8328 length:291 start_codon:yes stop_codon:yes gene_type:complete